MLDKYFYNNTEFEQKVKSEEWKVIDVQHFGFGSKEFRQNLRTALIETNGNIENIVVSN